MAYISQLKVNNTTYDIKSAVCTGNAATATKATQDGNGATIATTYLKLSGGTVTGNTEFTGGLTIKRTTTIADDTPAQLLFQSIQSNNNITSNAYIRVYDDHDAQSYGTNMIIYGAGNVIIGGGESPGSLYTEAIKGKSNANHTVGANAATFSETGENLILTADSAIYFLTNCNTIANRNLSYITTNGYYYGTRVYNAVWNDYAEYRTYNDGETPYGKVVCENGDDSVSLSTKRMQLGAMICSDTYGTCMGDENNGIPIAVAGRTLAYPFENREEYRNHIGEAVCAGPNGTVSLMTEEETLKYPNAIVGYVSAVPDYETWSTNNVAVNGRVWIKVK